MSDQDDPHLQATSIAPPLRAQVMVIALVFLLHWMGNILVALILGSSPPTAALGAAIASLGGAVAWAVFRAISGQGACMPFFFYSCLMAGGMTRGNFAVVPCLLSSGMMIYLSGVYAIGIRLYTGKSP